MRKIELPKEVVERIIELYLSGLNYYKVAKTVGIQYSKIKRILEENAIELREIAPKKEDLMGRTFHRLTVVSPNRDKFRRSSWNCQCSCGNAKLVIVVAADLKSGHTKSCGCQRKEDSVARVHLAYEKASKYTPRIATAIGIWRSKYSDGDISFDDFLELSQMNCSYCKKPPLQLRNEAKTKKHSSQYAKDNGDFIYNGLDRVNNSIKIHTKDNCVPCCYSCNYSKRDRNLDDWYSSMEQILRVRDERNLELEIQKM